MFEDQEPVLEADQAALTAHLSAQAPADSASAFAQLPKLLASGDDTPEAIHARIDLAVLTAREGFLQSALYQVDELTKDARRVSDLIGATGATSANGVPDLVQRADTCRNLVETAARNSRA